MKLLAPLAVLVLCSLGAAAAKKSRSSSGGGYDMPASSGYDSYDSGSGRGDSYKGDSYRGDSYRGDSYRGDSYGTGTKGSGKPYGSRTKGSSGQYGGNSDNYRSTPSQSYNSGSTKYDDYSGSGYSGSSNTGGSGGSVQYGNTGSDVVDYDAMACMVNEARAAAGQGPVKVDPKLNTIAQQWSETQTQVGMSHSNNVGGASVQGENVAYNQKDEKSVFNAWMASSGHRENIERGEYEAIGLGKAESDGPYWTQNFAYKASSQAYVPNCSGGSSYGGGGASLKAASSETPEDTPATSQEAPVEDNYYEGTYDGYKAEFEDFLKSRYGKGFAGRLQRR